MNIRRSLVGSPWKFIARRLELTNSDIAELDFNYPTDISERIYQVSNDIKIKYWSQIYLIFVSILPVFSALGSD